jgi:hypothetical protein
LEEAAKKQALQATLNEWDNDEQKQIKGETMSTTTKPAYLFQPTNNASRDTFNFVRDNPGLRIAEIKAGLPKHKPNTVGSLTYQMVMAGLLRKDENTSTFHAIKPEFEPFSINSIRRQKKKAAEPRKLVVVKRRTAQEAEAAHNANVAGTSAGLGALTASVELTSRPRPWRAEDVVDSLTLLQAKAVHAYLQQLFGAL